MKLIQQTPTLKLLALGLVLIAVANQVTAKPSNESTGQVQFSTDSDTLPGGQNLEQWRTREEGRAAKEAERAAKATERAAHRQQKLAEKAAKSAERASQRDATQAEKAAQRASYREAQRALSAAERTARKEARQAAREAQRAARNNARTLLTRGSNIRLDDSQCLAAINQCSLLDHMEAEMKPSWERTTLKKELKAVYKQRKDDLIRLKKYVIQLIDYTLQNPTVDQLASGLCDGVQNDQGNSGSDDDVQNDQGNAGPADGSVTTTDKTATSADPWTRASSSDPWTQTSSTTVDPWTDSTTLAQRCTCSQWSEWSAPYGFGTQERVRVIVRPGVVCPEAQQLQQKKNITSTTTVDGDFVIDDVQVVSNNFQNDFVREAEGKPRDLLLVLDSSGSISDDDFKAMKGGVQLLIDALCGGFGPAPNQHRLAIVQFSTFVRTVHTFGDDQDPQTLKAVVNKTTPMYGYTCTGDALQLAFDHFSASRGARDFTVHDTLIITDGRSNCGADILASSQTLQQRSNVYALAIGLSSDPGATTEITSLVSNRDPRHLFSLANFMDFQDMVQKVRNRQNVTQCQRIVSN